ncbi:MAG: sigma 54-interacting transcriptional regulator [Syntrophobacteraceae bacterium]|nr:sigma 54-interacting transcriptional regulator [Syntrophobacteraceae bacterium]
MKKKILVIEDDGNLRETFRRFLTKDGYAVDTADDYQSAVGLIESHSYDAIFTDINLSGEKSGLDILAECKGEKLCVPVVIITGFPSIESASEAVRLGGYDYLCKPVEKETLLHVARGAVRHKELSGQAHRFARNLEAVFRSVSDAIVSVDSQMLITCLNHGAEGFCVFDRDCVGKPLSETAASRACSQECQNRLLGAVKESIGTGKPVELHDYECSEKKAVYTLKVSPLEAGPGEKSGAVIVGRDETRLAALERDLDRRRDFHRIMVGKSEPMQAIYTLIESLGAIRSTVLITGASGTGKELAATGLHHAGSRRDKPLVKVNCSALTETLLESELFGHVKGAFTGAVHDRVGRFEMANGGTLFLDEIGDISPIVQQKLLRVLQEKEIERVGDSRPIKVDVRILAATNRDLKQMVAGGLFREDFYYRIKVVELKMPPLRARREDIPLLLDFFLNEFSVEFNKRIDGVSSDVMEMFMNYGWPGNVRELKHVIEHGAILCRRTKITLNDLPDDFGQSYPAPPTPAIEPQAVSKNAEALLQILQENKWNKTEAARNLGISRQTLYRKLKEVGIDE